MSSDSSTQHCLEKHYTTAKLLTESGTCLLMFSSLSANQIKMFRKLSAKSFGLIIAFEVHHYMANALNETQHEQIRCQLQIKMFQWNINTHVAVQKIHTHKTYRYRRSSPSWCTDLKWKLKYQSLRQTAGWGQY